VIIPLYLLAMWKLGWTYAPPRDPLWKVLRHSYQMNAPGSEYKAQLPSTPVALALKHSRAPMRDAHRWGIPSPSPTLTPSPSRSPHQVGLASRGVLSDASCPSPSGEASTSGGSAPQTEIPDVGFETAST
jgi:hypothetical protein